MRMIRRHRVLVTDRLQYLCASHPGLRERMYRGTLTYDEQHGVDIRLPPREGRVFHKMIRRSWARRDDWDQLS